jgi:hypothetical protein
MRKNNGRKEYFGLIVVAVLGFASSSNFQQIVRNIFYFVLITYLNKLNNYYICFSLSSKKALEKIHTNTSEVKCYLLSIVLIFFKCVCHFRQHLLSFLCELFSSNIVYNSTVQFFFYRETSFMLLTFVRTLTCVEFYLRTFSETKVDLNALVFRVILCIISSTFSIVLCFGNLEVF